MFSTTLIPYPHFCSVWICGSFLSKGKHSRIEQRFEKGNEKHWQARREILGWLLSFPNKLLEFKPGLAPSAQLLLPGFSCGNNSNKTLDCDEECCSQCHRITAFTHHKNNTILVWILGGLQGLDISKFYGSVWVWAFFWLVSHAKNSSLQKGSAPSASGAAPHPSSSSKDWRECAGWTQPRGADMEVMDDLHWFLCWAGRDTQS